jgi:hypothetical protein
MKKIVLTMVAAMAFTFSFAETKSDKADKGAENFFRSFVINDDTRFDMSCDMHRLAAVLDLDEWQTEAVEAAQNCLNNEIQSLASVRGPQLRHLVHQAVMKDAQQMKRVLNDKQFATYMMLLGTTLHNKHL